MENFLQMSLECTKEVCQHLIIKSKCTLSHLNFFFPYYTLDSLYMS